MQYLPLILIFVLSCSKTSTETPVSDDVGEDLAVDTQPGSPDVADDVENQVSPFTYVQDVKPIIDGRCVTCHVDGGIGPFSLGTFEEVRALKDVIASTTHARTMPPFLPSPGCREYVFDPNLSEEQIEIISSWASGGAAEGDPDDTREPLYPNIPQPPTFDTTVEMPEPYTPQNEPDDYRCFVIDWPHQTTKFVTGFGVEPGDARVVHHLIAYHATPDLVAEAEARDAAEPGPGYTCFGGPLLGDQNGQSPWLGAWAPGGSGSQYPVGTGLRVEPGSKVVLQVHYNTLATSPVPDQSRILFQTADAVDKEAYLHLWANPAWFTNSSMRIDAGNPEVSHRFLLDPTLANGGRPITLYSASVHMHLLGKRADVWVQRGAESECLVNVRNYDFGWQSSAGFVEPVTINPGDRLGIECFWDNSMDNQPMINGERLTPADRFWGEGTTDEMCLGIFYATID